MVNGVKATRGTFHANTSNYNCRDLETTFEITIYTILDMLHQIKCSGCQNVYANYSQSILNMYTILK